MHGIQNLFVLVWPGDGQHLGMRAGDVIGFRAQTTCDDHLAVLFQRLADRLQALGLGAVQKPAGVHDNRIRARVVGGNPVSFGAQPGQNAFAVDKRLGAAQRHHANGGLPGTSRVGEGRRGGQIRAQVRWVLAHKRGIGQACHAAQSRCDCAASVLR